MKNQSKLTKNHLSQRAIWLIVGLVALVLAITAWVYFANRGYFERVEQSQADLRQATKQVFSDDNLTSEKLNNYANQLAEAVDICQAGPVESFYLQVSRDARRQHQDCLEFAEKVAELERQTKAVSTRLTDESKLADTINQANSELNRLKPGQYKESQAVWKKTSQSVENLEISQSTEVRDAVKKSIDEIIKRYDALIKADQAKSRQKFDDASVELGKAYDQLNTSAKKLNNQAYRDLIDQAAAL